MQAETDYIAKNLRLWNSRTEHHITSEFYDVPGFLAGNTSLKSMELELLGDIKGKSILHLQCHFGQDTISLQRMGARSTGVDLSDKSIAYAIQLAAEAGQGDTRFVCCDLYSLPEHLDEQFDIVFSSYGTIGWLPDMDRWAAIVARYLKPGGRFVFAEFHPVVWMFDDDFQSIAYNYLNEGPIEEEEAGTYTDRNAPIKNEYIAWNHGLGEVLSSLAANGLRLDVLKEYNYSPYNCFRHTEEFEPGKFRIKHMGQRIPMMYALSATKNS